ncbi:MAG: hypothetical protein Q9196_004332 [Gyalolechia fulgens]
MMIATIELGGTMEEVTNIELGRGVQLEEIGTANHDITEIAQGTDMRRTFPDRVVEIVRGKDADREIET